MATTKLVSMDKKMNKSIDRPDLTLLTNGILMQLNTVCTNMLPKTWWDLESWTKLMYTKEKTYMQWGM